jgi:hypothetical protein
VARPLLQPPTCTSQLGGSTLIPATYLHVVTRWLNPSRCASRWLDPYCNGRVAARIRVTDHDCILRWSLGRVLLESHPLHTLHYQLPLFTCLYVACLTPVTVRHSEPGASVLSTLLHSLRLSHFPVPPPTSHLTGAFSTSPSVSKERWSQYYSKVLHKHTTAECNPILHHHMVPPNPSVIGTIQM